MKKLHEVLSDEAEIQEIETELADFFEDFDTDILHSTINEVDLMAVLEEVYDDIPTICEMYNDDDAYSGLQQPITLIKDNFPGFEQLFKTSVQEAFNKPAPDDICEDLWRDEPNVWQQAMLNAFDNFASTVRGNRAVLASTFPEEGAKILSYEDLGQTGYYTIYCSKSGLIHAIKQFCDNKNINFSFGQFDAFLKEYADWSEWVDDVTLDGKLVLSQSLEHVYARLVSESSPEKRALNIIKAAANSEEFSKQLKYSLMDLQEAD